jgi:PAS domain S-box-containing protein
MGSNRQDIAEGKRAEELLRAQRDLALAIGKAGSFEEGMRVCLETAIRISEMDCGGIYLRDETSGALDLVINRALPAEFIASASHYEKDAPNTQLVMAGRSIYSEHLQLGVPLDEAERREGLRAIAVIPILHEDRVIGCMNIASHTRAEVPPFARDALEAIAAQIGNAIIHLRTEEALRYQAALLADTHDAIIASDEHYRLTAWNAAAESLYGWKAEEVLGRFGLDILQTEFPGVEKSEMLRSIAETGHWRGEVTQARKDGTRIPVEVASIVLHDESGRISGYVSVNRDITERKRTEKALRESEEKYRGLTENVNLGIYRNTVGPEGKFIEANPAIIRMFGYKSKGEFLAINVSDLYQNAEDRKKFNDKMLKEGFVKNEELWLKRKDGSLFVGSVSAVAVKDEQGHMKYYDGIIDNITERKRAEEALRESEARYRSVARLSSDFAYSCVCTGDDGYEVDWITDAFFTRTGYSKAELHEQRCWMFVSHPDDREMATKPLRELKAGESDSSEFRIVTKEGRVLYIVNYMECQADPEARGGLRLFGAVQDITERKRAELEYKTIVGTAMDGFWIIDAQGRFLDTNDAYCRLIGYSREELVEMKISDIEAKEKLKETVRRIRKIMEVGGDRFETRHRCKDGRVIDIEVSTKYNKESGDKLYAFLRDITQRKQMGEALAKYIGELQRLSKQLIAVQEAERLRISQELHDEMGQALTMLRINIASIKESLPPACTKGIKDRLADADALTEKLLAQIHELTLELRPHMLDDLGLVSTLRWYTERLSRRLNIQILFTQKNWKERPDSEISTALFRIIQEALTNAAKHARAKKIRILLAQKQKFIELIIQDDGCGFDQRKIEKRPSRARGIGLFSMKERAALLNGECTIESHPGKGTRIHIRIPRRKAVEKN